MLTYNFTLSDCWTIGDKVETKLEGLLKEEDEEKLRRAVLVMLASNAPKTIKLIHNNLRCSLHTAKILLKVLWENNCHDFQIDYAVNDLTDKFNEKDLQEFQLKIVSYQKTPVDSLKLPGKAKRKTPEDSSLVKQSSKKKKTNILDNSLAAAHAKIEYLEQENTSLQHKITHLQADYAQSEIKHQIATHEYQTNFNALSAELMEAKQKLKFFNQPQPYDYQMLEIFKQSNSKLGAENNYLKNELQRMEQRYVALKNEYHAMSEINVKQSYPVTIQNHEYQQTFLNYQPLFNVFPVSSHSIDNAEAERNYEEHQAQYSVPGFN